MCVSFYIVGKKAEGGRVGTNSQRMKAQLIEYHGLKGGEEKGFFDALLSLLNVDLLSSSKLVIFYVVLCVVLFFFCSLNWL